MKRFKSGLPLRRSTRAAPPCPPRRMPASREEGSEERGVPVHARCVERNWQQNGEIITTKAAEEAKKTSLTVGASARTYAKKAMAKNCLSSDAATLHFIVSASTRTCNSRCVPLHLKCITPVIDWVLTRVSSPFVLRRWKDDARGAWPGPALPQIARMSYLALGWAHAPRHW